MSGVPMKNSRMLTALRGGQRGISEIYSSSEAARISGLSPAVAMPELWCRCLDF